MTDNLEQIFTNLKARFDSPGEILSLIVSLTVSFSVLAVFLSVYNNFRTSQPFKQAKKEKKSIVETGTMTGFFVLYYCLVRFQIGTYQIPNTWLELTLVFVGLFLVVFGSFVNVRARNNLGKNWANQIRIYKNQTLVTDGFYKIVRHPLYASLIWMFFGGALVFSNYLAALANLLIFVPFMYYRAKQEEALLSQEFAEYSQYRQKTGMFFPKIIK